MLRRITIGTLLPDALEIYVLSARVSPRTSIIRASWPEEMVREFMVSITMSRFVGADGNNNIP